MRSIKPIWFQRQKPNEDISKSFTSPSPSSVSKGSKLRPTNGTLTNALKSKASVTQTSSKSSKSPSFSNKNSSYFSNNSASLSPEFTYGFGTNKSSEEIFNNLTLALTYLDTVLSHFEVLDWDKEEQNRLSS